MIKKLFPFIIAALVLVSSCNLQGPDGYIRVENESGSTMTQVFISNSNSSTWGYDKTGNKSIPDGSYEIFAVTPANYDVLVNISGKGVHNIKVTAVVSEQTRIFRAETDKLVLIQ